MDNQTTKTLPAIAVRGIVPIPNTDFRTEIGREISFKALDESEKTFGSFIILLVQKNPLIESPQPSDIEPFGVLAKITMKIKLPNGNFKAKFKIIERVEVTDFYITSPYFMVEYETRESISGNYDEEMTLVRMVVSEVAANANSVLNNPQEIMSTIQSGITSDKVADIIANSLKTLDVTKIKYLKETHVNKRLKYILEDIEREKMIANIEQRINEDVKKSIDENQKEYYLREKMRAIQNELGDKAKKEEEVDEIRAKILSAKMPKKIEEKALQE